MSNKDTTISKMNSYGRERRPFLFIIDFEMINCKAVLLDELDNNRILFDINGISNCREQVIHEKPVSFIKYPVSFGKYSGMFEKVKYQITDGNTYLLNLTCETPIVINLSLKEVFLLSKAKYKLWYDDVFVVFSPEIFVKIRNNRIESFPMKGTTDASLHDAEQALLDDPKELAEHYTIVDLIRNDLNMVASDVRVAQFRYIERIETNQKTLLQASSRISGQLQDNYHSHLGDIIFGMLPAGSVTGAPKKKTLDIIRETENYCRGFYTGIFGLFDGNNIDSGVMIRFIENTVKGKVFKSGGGITAFSDCRLEYEEMKDKVYVPIV